MKKLFAVLALAGVMVSCNNKKKDEKAPEKDTTTTTNTTNTTTETTTETTTAPAGVPTFSDPEVQKFANDYAAFITQYKSGMTDPAKAAELAKSAQEWSKRSTEIAMKLAAKPDEAKAFSEWLMGLAKEMMPATK